MNPLHLTSTSEDKAVIEPVELLDPAVKLANTNIPATFAGARNGDSV